MAISSGVRYALSEAASWLCAASIMIGGVVYFDELKAGVSHALGMTLDGVAESGSQRSGGGRLQAAQQNSSGTVEIKASSNGHFHTPVSINGRRVDVMVDTGATMVALTYEDAERAGIFVKPSDFTHRVSTANGHARIAPVTLDMVQIGDITVRNVKAAVSERGRLDVTLLGMTFLGRLSRTEIRRGTLVLQE